jgi:YVTN family beta-propeller protein
VTRVRLIPTWLLVGALVGCSGAPDTSPGTSPVAVAPSTGPAATKRPARPSQLPATPIVGTYQGFPSRTLSLGTDAAPIDVTYAFGSIWVANHHKDSVVRLDPGTMATQATIKVGQGPGWFVATDDALWVSEQLGHGLSRIDPSANVAEPHIGLYATCGRGTAALGYVWQPACDAHQIMRIDPAENRSLDISSGDITTLVLAGDALIACGPDGLARVDAETGALTPIGGPGYWAIGYAGGTVLVAGDESLARVRPSDGKVTATLPIARAGMMLAVGDHAWIGSEGPELQEIDLVTNRILRTITVDPWPGSVVNAAGALWITNFERSSLIRLEL